MKYYAPLMYLALAVCGLGIAITLRARVPCVPPVPPKSYGDCSENADPGLAYCVTRDGRVFTWWTDGRWLEVVPKNGH